MLRTLPQTRDSGIVFRVAGIGLFVILTIISAKLSIEFGGPVPFTLQVFAVLLSGMVLGPVDGAITQLSYLALLAIGLPFDSRGIGAAALVGPTGGYLIGFVPAAFVAGWIVQKGTKFWVRFLAGIAGIIVIYVFGAGYLMIYTGSNFQTVWAEGIAPFIALDLVKALIAAGCVEGVRQWLSIPRDK